MAELVTWVIIIGIVAVLVFDGIRNSQERSTYDPGVVVPNTNVGGYENPAPGDDGSYDCPPGDGPVYVGSYDPAGLDGDGDGWGCE
jgi:hypothetical protein